MDSFLKLYFGNGLARSRVIMTILYLIASVLIINKILGMFNISYSFPKEISLSTAFEFVLSGQILYAVAGVFVYSSIIELLASLIAGYLYRRFKFILFRSIYDEGMIGKIELELVQKKFISLSFTHDSKKSRPQKGNAFHHFEPFMKQAFWDEFNTGLFLKMLSNTMFAVMVALGLYMNQNLLLITGFVISILGWLLFSITYWQFARVNEYREIYEVIYYNLVDPENAREVKVVSTINKHYIKFKAWETKQKAKQEAKKQRAIENRKL